MLILSIVFCITVHAMLYASSEDTPSSKSEERTTGTKQPHLTQAPDPRRQDFLDIAQEQQAQRALTTEALQDIARQNQEKAQAKTQALLDTVQINRKEQSKPAREEIGGTKDASAQAQELFDNALAPYITDNTLNEKGVITWPDDAQQQQKIITSIHALLEDIAKTLKALHRKNAQDPLKKYIFKASLTAPGRHEPFKKIVKTLQSIKELIDSEFARLKADKNSSRAAQRTIANIEKTYKQITSLITL
ncbi:MAG: hypothetical protein WC707_01095 [Candidatus Babeliaceae bacterium]|jgi:hypothetical protein